MKTVDKMGCFDYECECGGKTCDHVGGQLHDSNVVIEVPLTDGTTVYLEGHYEQYGYVTVEGYQFYLEQFRDYFEGWFGDEAHPEKIFLAKRVWTLNETVYKYLEDSDGEGYEVDKFVHRKCFRRDIDVNLSELDPMDVSKYVRADKGLDLEAKRKKKLANLKSQLQYMQREIARLEKL